MTTRLKWTGTMMGIAGALWLALNLSSSGWAFVLLTISAFCWLGAGWRMREPSLIALNFVYCAINAVGIYRWLF